MLFRRGENAQSRSVGGISSSRGIEFFPQSANKLRFAVYHREHPAKEEEVARLHRLDIRTKRRRGDRELNAKVLQPTICTGQLQTFTAYQRPPCAPSSMCSTSPVMARTTAAPMPCEAPVTTTVFLLAILSSCCSREPRRILANYRPRIVLIELILLLLVENNILANHEFTVRERTSSGKDFKLTLRISRPCYYGRRVV